MLEADPIVEVWDALLISGLWKTLRIGCFSPLYSTAS